MLDRSAKMWYNIRGDIFFFFFFNKVKILLDKKFFPASEKRLDKPQKIRQDQEKNK